MAKPTTETNDISDQDIQKALSNLWSELDNEIDAVKKLKLTPVQNKVLIELIKNTVINNIKSLPTKINNKTTSDSKFITKLAYTINNEKEMNKKTETKIDDTGKNDSETNKKDAETDKKAEKKEDIYSVDVFVRVRPLVGKELTEKHEKIEFSVKNKKNNIQSFILKKIDSSQLNNGKQPIRRNKNKGKSKELTYKGIKQIIKPDNDNIVTYNACIKPIVSNYFDGTSVCVFAYGHTGSGKTHTIFGYGDKHPGMYKLFTKQLCDKVNKLNNDTKIFVRFLELYDGKIRDLLSKDKTECYLRENERGEVKLRLPTVTYKDGVVVAPPITGTKVSNEEEIEKAIGEGIKSRNVGESTLHDKSSRSHAFLEFELLSDKLISVRNELARADGELVKILNSYTWEDYEKKENKKKEIKELFDKKNSIENDSNRPYIGNTFVFVDLAGNEFGMDTKKINKPDYKNMSKDEIIALKKKDILETKERNEINSSLLSLKEVIRALNSKRKHIPYRNHKLTLYLKQYLTGFKCKGVMISNIGSSKTHIKKSINTLRYTESIANANK